MSPITLPRLFVSDTEGWQEFAESHPPAARMAMAYVAPLSLLPPLMFAFAQEMYPGRITPLVEPPFSAGELALVGVAVFLAQMALVSLMGSYIQQMTDAVGVLVPYGDAYRLAAIAPTPLWLSTLALAVPSPWFVLGVVALAWIGSVALIRHGTGTLLGVTDRDTAHRVADAIVVAGMGIWVGLLVLLVFCLGILLGWR